MQRAVGLALMVFIFVSVVVVHFCWLVGENFLGKIQTPWVSEQMCLFVVVWVLCFSLLRVVATEGR